MQAQEALGKTVTIRMSPQGGGIDSGQRILPYSVIDYVNIVPDMQYPTNPNYQWLDLGNSHYVNYIYPPNGLRFQLIGSPPEQFDPYDQDTVPDVGVFTLAPMTNDTRTLDPMDTYIPNDGKDYPATRFPRRNVAVVPGTYKWDFSQWPAQQGGWAKILRAINPESFNYLWNRSDGVQFNGNIRCVVFPENQIHFKQAQFIKAVGMVAQWYGIVDYYSFSNPPASLNPSLVPPYLLQNQTDQNHAGKVVTSMDERGWNVYIPLVSKYKLYAPYTWVKYT